MELDRRKIVVFMLILGVILFVLPTIMENPFLVETGISDIKLTQLKQNCEASDRMCDFKNCDLEECTEKEIREWEGLSQYVEECNSKVEENEDDGCDQDKLYQKISDGLEEIDISETISTTNFGNQINYEDIEVSDCEVIEGDFNPTNIVGTPYWITTKGETGSDSLIPKLGQVVIDTGGTHSYGNFGLNSRGDAPTFWREYGEEIGLTGTPGTETAKESWKITAEENPTALALAEVQWYNDHIIDPVISYLNSKYPQEIANDPRLVGYVSDIRIQEGNTLYKGTINAVPYENGESVEKYLKKLAEYQASDEFLNKRYRTYLSEHPENREGLKARITQKRYPLSLQVNIIKLGENTRVECNT